MKTTETMWAKNIRDESGRSVWYTYADGDDQGGHERIVNLDAGTFPPGTRISIQEPVCPECEEPRGYKGTVNGVAIYKAVCYCGFDWKQWEEATFG